MAQRPGKVLLIDANSLLSRAFYALPALTTREGSPTHAVYGLALMLGRLLEDEAPDRVVAAFDLGAPTFRHEAYRAYKAHRPRMPDALRAQVPLAKELLAAHGVCVVELAGYEADDILGTLAASAAGRGMDVRIVTGDKDALQLVDEHVEVLLVRKGITDVVRCDAAEVVRQLGVAPRQVPDLKGLMGDASDNIPGVPGIGPKTARRLLQEFATLEELVERRDEVPGKAGEAIRRHWQVALLSKQLATIDRDAPVEIDWDRVPPVRVRVEELRRLYGRLEFHTLLESLLKQAAPEGRTGGGATRSRWGGPVTIARSLDEVEEALSGLARSDLLAIAAVWEGPPRRAEVVGVAVAGEKRSVYLPVGHRPDPRVNVDSEALAGPVRELLGSSLPKACHDVKAHCHALARIGLPLDGVVVDTMIAAYLLDPDRGGNPLEAVVLRLTGDSLEPSAWAAGAGAKSAPRELARLSPEEVAHAALPRARAVLQLARMLPDLLRQEGLETLYRDVELPLAQALVDIERLGVRVDVGELDRLAKQMEEELAELASRAFRLAGEEFNLNSPRQLARILYDKLGLPVVSRAKSAPSTSAAALESIADRHEIVRVVLEHRRLHKLKSGYADSLPRLVDPGTGRIHTTFHQAVAATGRLSSSDPNLQNIPVRGERGREIRRAFVPRPGWLMLRADYNQIELRVLAHLADDPVLIDGFRRGEDVHTKTAASLFGIRPDEVTPEQRRAAKAVNFGIIYGISGFGLAKGAGLSRADAEAFIRSYFDRHPAVRRYVEETIAAARERGFVTTLFGRRRYLPGLHSRRRPEQKLAERMAVNTPIQGSAADIIKAALLAVRRRLFQERLEAALLLQVHDELLFEAPPGEIERLAQIVKEAMEGVVTLKAPLVVGLAAGPNWLDGSEVSLHA